MAWTAPRTWVASEVVTAALLNTHVRDNLLALSTYTTYTPTWAATSGTAPTIGNGTLTGLYLATSDWVEVLIHLVGGSTTVWGTGGSYTFTLPFTSAARSFVLQGVVVDTSLPDDWPIMARRTAASVVTLRRWGATAGGPFVNVNGGGTSPHAWATGDEILLSGRYQR